MRRKFIKANSDDEVWIKLDRFKIKWDQHVASDFQFRTKQYLKKFWINDFVLEEAALIPENRRLRFDFVNLNKMLILETDGKFHDSYIDHFAKGCRLNWLDQITRDMVKREWAEKNGFKVLNIYPEDKLSLTFFKDTFGISII